VITNPIDGLNIVTGYAYNYSSFTKSAASVLGRRPVDAGPTHLANLWVSYTLLKGNLSGLGAGFGGNYAGKNIITNTVATGKFTLPAYTVLNATAFYNTKHYRLGLKVDNLTNKQYFKGWTTVEPQMPLSVVANLTYKF
jgi:iron complex outermembrane receptor protein